MNLNWVDWSIIVGLASTIIVMAYVTKKYTKSVADFLSANRCAGKYLLAVSDGIAGLGAISIIALFEMYYKAGFTAIWWQTMLMPIGTIIAMTGWVQYRFRQTRAMTMAQFFEMRYSRKFRIFAGFIIFTSGLINFAIFPAVGGRFFQYYLGIPKAIVTLGILEIDLVFLSLMAILLFISLLFTFMGGQIAVIVTDFIQGIFCNAMFIIIGAYLILSFDWSQIAEAISTAPINASLVNPIKTSQTDNFNVTYFLIGVFGTSFTYMAWQGNQGYFSAARTPHEARMGRVIGMLRALTQTLPIVLLPICAYTILHHVNFSSEASEANQILQSISNQQIRSQLTVTVILTKFLPAGLLGGFAAVMFAAFISTHDTYLHAWGSIFIQDVVLPVRQFFKGKDVPLAPKAHIQLLRISIVGVAVFIFLFSLFFNQQQDILMYFALTGTIFLGWAGAAIIGGLYSKWGTTAGAWSAAIVGVIMAVVGWYLTYFWSNCQHILQSIAPYFWEAALQKLPELANSKFPVNAQILWFYTMLSSAATYLIVSLVTRRSRLFNLDRLLHRGQYALNPHHAPDARIRTGLKIFRMGKEFTRGDKFIFVSAYGYTFLFTGVFLIGTIYSLNYDIADQSWMAFWKHYCWLVLILGTIFTVWIATGGFGDLKTMLRTLRTATRDASDDGSVREDESAENEK
ncbi:sodium:solute symporter [candidate division KSB1 bacterium]|nr:sodium:solute symporter [candidate division KSB1 bacterium]